MDRNLDKKKISYKTVFEVAKNIADNPITILEAEEYSKILEDIQHNISQLKYLDIKNIEPAISYCPFEEIEDE